MTSFRGLNSKYPKKKAAALQTTFMVRSTPGTVNEHRSRFPELVLYALVIAVFFTNFLKFWNKDLFAINDRWQNKFKSISPHLRSFPPEVLTCQESSPSSPSTQYRIQFYVNVKPVFFLDYFFYTYTNNCVLAGFYRTYPFVDLSTLPLLGVTFSSKSVQIVEWKFSSHTSACCVRVVILWIQLVNKQRGKSLFHLLRRQCISFLYKRRVKIRIKYFNIL